MTKNKMNETAAKRETLKFMDLMYEIKLLKNIFEVAGADSYNSITIENKGTANDTDVVLFIDGIRFVAGIENKKPNVEKEGNLIKIKIIRPEDKIYLQVWTYKLLFSLAESRRFRASSDAGIIAVSVH